MGKKPSYNDLLNEVKDLRKKTKNLEIIHKVAKDIYGTFNIKTVMEKAVKAMKNYSHSPAVALFFVNKKEKVLELMHSDGFTEESLKAAAKLPYKDSISGIAVKTKKIVTSDDLANDQRIYKKAQKSLTKEKLKSVISIPLLCQNQVHGVMNLIYQEQNIISEQDKKNLFSIGRIVGLALANSKFVSQIKAEIEERKKSEEKYKKQTIANELILKTTLSGYILADTKGIIVNVNPAYCKMIGYSKKELIGKDIREIEISIPKPEVDRRIKQMIDKGKDRFETQHKCKNGKIIDLDVNISITSVDNNTLVTAFVNNITKRKETEKSLIESEEIYRKLSTYSPIGIYKTDKAGNCIYVNKRYTEITGSTSNQALGTGWIEKLHPDDIELVVTAWNNLVETKHPFDQEYRFCPAKNKITWVRGQASKLLDDKGDVIGYIGSVSDITKRKSAELKLQKSEEEFRKLTTSSPVGVFKIDDKGQCVTYINKQYTSITGLSFNKVKGMGWVKYIHPEDKNFALKEWMEYLVGEKKFDLEYRIIAPKNKVIWLREQAAKLLNEKNIVVGHIGTISDVTKRKIAEEKLSESEQKFRTLFEQAAVGVAQIETKTGRFIQVNQKYCDIVGYSEKEMLNINFQKITHEDDLESDLKNMKLLKAGKIDEFTMEKRYYHKNKSIVWVTLTVSPMLKIGKNIYYHVAIVEDITARKRAEQDLLKTNRQLRMLSDCNQVLVRAQDEITLEQAICNTIIEKGGYQLAWVGLANHDKGKTVTLVAKAGFDDGYLNGIKITWKNDQYGKGPAGRAIRTGKPQIANNILKDKSFTPWRKQALKRGYASVISVPLIAKKNIFGVLYIYSKDQDAFDEKEKKLLEELAEDLAFGIKNLRNQKKQQESEEKLKINNERFRSLMEHTGEGFYLIEAAKPVPVTMSVDEQVSLFYEWRYVECNDAMAKMYGYSKAEEIIGKSMGSVMGGVNNPINTASIKEVINSGYNVTGTITKESDCRGNVVWFSSNIVGIIENDCIVRIWGTSIDITSIKLAEDALRKEKQFTDMALDAQQDTFFLFDISTGKALRWNKAFSELTGYSDEEIVNMPAPSSYYVKEDLVKAATFIEKVLVEESGTIELNLINKNGNVIPIEYRASVINDNMGEPKFLVSIGRDITYRKKVDEELRKLSEVVKQSPMYIVITDLNGDIEYVNPAFEKVTGYSFEEVVHKNPGILKSGEIPKTTYEELWNAILSGQTWKGELKNKKKNGSIYWESATISPSFDTDGKITHFIGVKEDITDRKITQENMLLAKKRFETLFEYSPVPLWEEDFSELYEYLDELKEKGVLDFRDYFDKNPLELENCSRKIKITNVNHATLDLHNAKNKEDLLVNIDKIFTEKSFGTFKEEVIALAQGDLSFEIEGEVKTITGEPRQVFLKLRIEKVNGKKDRALLATIDITKRKQVEQALLSAKEYVENLIETANTIVVGLDVNGKINVFNKTAERITGYKKSEIMEKNWFETLVPRDRYPEVWTVFERSNTGELSKNFENPILTKTGEERFIAWQNNELFENGRFAGTISFGMDITERKQAEDIMRKSSVIIGSITDAVITTDLSGIITFWNKGAEITFGYKQSEAIGSPVSMLYKADDLNLLENIISKLHKGKSIKGLELTSLKKDHTELEMLLSLTPSKDAEGNVVAFIGTSKDITDMKKTENRLKDAQRIGSIGDWEIDIVNNKINWSEEVFRLFERDPELGTPDFEELMSYYTPESQELSIKNVNRAIEFGEETDSDYHLVLPRGKQVFQRGVIKVEKNNEGKVVKLFGTVQDITKRKLAENELFTLNQELEERIKKRTEELWVSQEKLRATIASMDDLIFVLDNNGIVTGFYQPEKLIHSKKFYKSPEIFIGKHYKNVLPPKLVKLFEKAIVSIISKDKVQEIDYSLKEQGEVLWFNAKMSAQKDSNGEFAGVTIVIRDITDRKKDEEKIKKINIKLRETDKLKSIFIASMSHELRTPLNSIIGFTSIILMGMTGQISDEQRKQLNIVKDNANHLLSLINDVLDISKIEAGKLSIETEKINLSKIIIEVINNLLPQLKEKKLTLYKKINSNIKIFSNMRRIKQVLINIVNNAIKFTDEGKISIETMVNKKENQVKIIIIDTGIGIKDEDLEKLFEPFQQLNMTTTKEYVGTGLGLYLSKKLCNMLQGDLFVKSEFGKGTQFTIELPIEK